MHLAPPPYHDNKDARPHCNTKRRLNNATNALCATNNPARPYHVALLPSSICTPSGTPQNEACNQTHKQQKFPQTSLNRT
jgi:hypothetical protein